MTLDLDCLSSKPDSVKSLLVTQAPPLTLSVPLFSHLYNEVDNSTYQGGLM